MSVPNQQPSTLQVLKQIQEPAPVFNSRTCIKPLPYDYISSDIAICNLGSYDPAVNGRTGIFYPFGIGATKSILTIRLTADGQTIDEKRDLGKYLTRQFLLNSNETSEDINRFDVLNSVNIGLNPATQAMTYSDTRTDYFHTYGTAAGNSSYCPGGSAYQINNALDADNNVTGLLYLRDVFDFLKSNPILPPIRNFQIEIEWERRGSSFTQDPRVIAGGVNNLAQINPLPNPPLFIYDLIVGAPEMAPNTVLSYTTIDIDRARLPPTNGLTQTEDFQIKGFSNKYVKDITVLTEMPNLGNDDTFPFAANNMSPQQAEETINLTVNNRKIIPLGGIDTAAKKMMFFSEAYGPLNLHYAAMNTLIDPSGYFLDANDPYTANINGGYAPSGFSVNAMIDTLQCNYKRGGGSTAKDNGALTLVFLATVMRKIMYTNGTITKMS